MGNRSTIINQASVASANYVTNMVAEAKRFNDLLPLYVSDPAIVHAAIPGESHGRSADQRREMGGTHQRQWQKYRSSVNVKSRTAAAKGSGRFVNRKFKKFYASHFAFKPA
jgi:hypothetical protein